MNIPAHAASASVHVPSSVSVIPPRAHRCVLHLATRQLPVARYSAHLNAKLDAGLRPFHYKPQDSAAAIMQRAAAQEHVDRLFSMLELNGASEDLVDLLKHMLTINPSDRYCMRQVSCMHACAESHMPGKRKHAHCSCFQHAEFVNICGAPHTGCQQ